MNWVKANKFLAGFFAVLLIGAGVLGYEVYSASSDYDDTSAKYTTLSAEYNRLRHLVPYPNRQNLDAYQEQKKDAAEYITAFEADLAKKEFPFEPMTPSGFQDKLKASVSAVRAKAQDSGIKLPEPKFYLAFDKYEGVPPSDEAATPLGRELKAIEWVVNQYLSQSPATMQSIVSIARDDLPEERGPGRPGRGPTAGGPGGQGGPGKPGPGGAGAGGGSERRGLVKYHPFDITVICKPAALRAVLNAVTGPKAPQFYVLRMIRIHNQKEKGPSRGGDPNQPDQEKKGPQYIVGEEWIEVAARYDVVDFAKPAEKPVAEKSGPAPKATPPVNKP